MATAFGISSTRPCTDWVNTVDHSTQYFTKQRRLSMTQELFHSVESFAQPFHNRNP